VVEEKGDATEQLSFDMDGWKYAGDCLKAKANRRIAGVGAVDPPSRVAESSCLWDFGSLLLLPWHPCRILHGTLLRRWLPGTNAAQRRPSRAQNAGGESHAHTRRTRILTCDAPDSSSSSFIYLSL
jgi:hypothetical protein